jgi:hypothetical protein
MSDSQKFGGAPAVEVADQAPIPTEVEEPTRRFSPKMLMVAGGVVVVLALAAYFLLFSGGGDDTSASSGVVPAAPKTSTAPSQPAASAKPSTAPATSGNGLSSGGRDPFEPLVVPATPKPSTAASATTAPTAPAAGGGTTTAGVQSTLAVSSVSYSGQTANVTVDGKSYVAHPNELFAKYYLLKGVLSGTSQCAVFTFGDLPAQVCAGQAVKFTG